MYTYKLISLLINFFSEKTEFINYDVWNVLFNTLTYWLKTTKTKWNTMTIAIEFFNFVFYWEEKVRNFVRKKQLRYVNYWLDSFALPVSNL